MSLLSNEHNLIEYAKQGNIVLFLGAGASISAKNSVGESPPLADLLAKQLSERFLRGQVNDSSLAEVSECAAAGTSTIEVEKFVGTIFKDYEPGYAHSLLPKFSWAGIATTNYDLFVEAAFEKDRGAIQDLVPYIHDGQARKFEEGKNDLAYLKLHGCLSHIGRCTVPLVLTHEQYLDYEKGRTSLFDTFEEWARKYTFVFIGYGAKDLNIRHYITRLVHNVDERMRFYFVRPGWHATEIKFWETRKVTAINASFDDFMRELDRNVDDQFRGMRLESKMPPSLRQHFSSQDYTLTQNASKFFETSAKLVESIDVDCEESPKQFFDGNCSGWRFLQQGWDVKRDVIEDIFIEVLLDQIGSDSSEPKLILLKGYAGSGKTVALKRLSWDLANEHQAMVIYIDRSDDLNSGALSEIVDLTKKHIFVVIDDLGKSYSRFKNCFHGLGKSSESITFIAGIRTNDWNSIRQYYSFIKLYEYNIGDLKHEEMIQLLSKLKENKCLGKLEKLSEERRIEIFRDVASKQLLVAMYEATRGKSFEDIIIDEYQNLNSDEAQSVYLTVCMLNRLNVPVRATLISRIHNLPYKEFVDRLFDPLEGVIQNRYDQSIRDYIYTARHPYIAEMIFRTILTDQESRFEEYFRVLKTLNLAYKSDEIAFFELIRGRVLTDLFSDPEYVKAIFEVAELKKPENANIFHQKAVFEMNRSGGCLEVAQDYIDYALYLSPNSNFVKHSAAELLVKRAEAATSDLVRERLLRKAHITSSALAKSTKTTHAKHTLAKISLARANAYVETSAEKFCISHLKELIKDSQKEVDSALQINPGDSYLLDAKSKLSRLIGAHSLALGSLEEAFKSNPHIGYIAMQLHSCYYDNGEPEKAEGVLRRCLEVNRNARSVNYALGKFLMDHGGNPSESIVYLKRSFVEGDSNLDAQLRYGRECYRAQDFGECERHFGTVRATRFPPRLGSDTLYPLDAFQRGTVAEIHARYMVIRDITSGMMIRLYREYADSAVFRESVGGDKVEYRVGVSVYGLRAMDARLPERAPSLLE